VGLGYNQSYISVQSPGNSASASSRRLQEAVTLTNSGFYVLDPRLITGSAGVQLDLGQSSAGESSTADRSVGYTFSADMLSQKPYNASLQANRGMVRSNQSFGTRTEGVHEARGVTLRLTENSILTEKGFPWFSATLDTQLEKHRDVQSYLDRSIQRDDSRRSLDLSAHKGFTTADLNFHYNINQGQNVFFGVLQPERQGRNASTAYSLDFGAGLNHHFDANLDYSDSRTAGEIQSRGFAGNSHVQLTHSNNLTTDYTAGFTRTALAGQTTLQQNMGLSIAHQLYTNLTTNAGMNVGRTLVDSGSATSNSVSLNQTYTHGIPRNGRLSLNWGGGRGLSTTNFSSGTLQMGAIGKVMPPFGVGSGFLLDHDRVVPETIFIKNYQTNQPMVRDVDFTVVALGARTRIDFIDRGIDDVATPGEPLELSYAREVDPNSRVMSRNLGFGATVDYQWIRVTYQHQQSEQVPLLGEGLFLTSSRNDMVQTVLRGTLYDISADGNISLNRSGRDEPDNHVVETTLSLEGHGVWQEFDGQGAISLNQYRDSMLAYNRRAIAASLIWQLRYNLNVVFNGSANDMNNLTSGRSDSSRALRGTLSWQSPEGLNLSGYGELRLHNSGVGGGETVLQLGVRAQQHIGKLSVNGGAGMDRWVKGGSRSMGLRLDVNAVRNF